MKRAKRIAYGLIADEIEFLIDRHGATLSTDDDWLAVMAELQRLHDKFQLKAEPDRIEPSMRLDDLERLNGYEPERVDAVPGRPLPDGVEGVSLGRANNGTVNHG